MPNERKTRVLLVILDGWGIGNDDESNPIHFANPQTLGYIQKTFPSGMLQASGVAIGLSWEESSSSELGHLVMGSGRALHAYAKEIFSKTSPISETLGEILSQHNKVQMRIAEEARYEHITYFFNGLRNDPFPNEYRVRIPSEKTLHPETHPEMMASAVTDRVIISLKEKAFDFIAITYANPDVIAFTGNYEATIKTVQTIDGELKRLMDTVLEESILMIITSSHGNAEAVLNLKTGETEKTNDPNPVPLYLVGNEYILKNPHPDIYHLPPLGIISDIAPTILDLMGIKKPKSMTGESLLSQLK